MYISTIERILKSLVLGAFCSLNHVIVQCAKICHSIHTSSCIKYIFLTQTLFRGRLFLLLYVSAIYIIDLCVCMSLLHTVHWIILSNLEKYYYVTLLGRIWNVTYWLPSICGASPPHLIGLVSNFSSLELNAAFVVTHVDTYWKSWLTTLHIYLHFCVWQ